jgi:hypothetical protein
MTCLAGTSARSSIQDSEICCAAVPYRSEPRWHDHAAGVALRAAATKASSSPGMSGPLGW